MHDNDEKKLYKIEKFLKSFKFFDNDFFNKIRKKIKFVNNIDTNKKLIDNNMIYLPYPYSNKNFLYCLDILCDKYLLFLKEKGKYVDDIYLEILKNSLHRIYLTENLSENSFIKYNMEILHNINNYNDKELIGIALSMEICDMYNSTKIFLIPDEYFYDSEKAKESIIIDIEYNYKIK